MNPQKNNPDRLQPDILPPPLQVVTQSVFPPLGTSLPTYAQPNPQRTPSAPVPLHGEVQQKRQRNWRKIVKRTLIVLLITAILIGGYVGAKVLTNAGKSLKGSLFGLLQTQKLHGEDVGRVNILLAGNSADDAGHSGGDLTDSIMIISIDTVNKQAFLLSVPRDLWVKIPGEGYGKINSAYVYGKANNFTNTGYPAGGMGELEQIIENNFNIKLNYYSLVNYTALRDAVNAVGGIDVNIASSDPRGLYDPSRDYTGPRGTPLVKLTNGLHHLNGQQALNLARARGDNYGAYGYAQSDFTRTANQRLMLTALKVKAVSAGVLSNPVKIGNLFDSFGNNVQTDFQTNEVRRLYDLVKDIPSANITSASLNDADGKNLLAGYRSYNGQSALIPASGLDNYKAIDAYLQKLMTPPASTPSPAMDSNTSN